VACNQINDENGAKTKRKMPYTVEKDGTLFVEKLNVYWKLIGFEIPLLSA